MRITWKACYICVDNLTVLLSSNYMFFLFICDFRLPCLYFSVFSFFLIVEKNLPTLSPQQPHLFISLDYNSSPSCFYLFSLWCCLTMGIPTTVCVCVSGVTYFLLFHLNTFITVRVCVLSLQIWVNTSAMRSVWACITLWERDLAVHPRKCLSERQVCFFSNWTARLLVCSVFVFVS